MKKILIPTILTATVLVAGMFAFMPIEKASTVHTTITASALTAVSSASASNSCDADGDDGTITWDLDAGVDSAALVGLYIDADEATDAGDFLTLEINADGVEIVGAAVEAAYVYDDDTTTLAATDQDILRTFDHDGSDIAAGEAYVGYPIGFTDTLSLDVACEFDDGDVDYVVTAVMLVPGGDGTPVAVGDTIP